MVSVESVIEKLSHASAELLILMQEGMDGTGEIVNVEWADEMFDAHELTNKAIKSVQRAVLLDR